jgi:AraC-like DNA-binding protein
MSVLPTEINLTVLTAHRSLLGAGWRGEGRNEPFHRLYFLHGGTGRMRHHGRFFTLQPGWLYLIPGCELFEMLGAKSMDISWTHFQARIWEGLDLFRAFSCPFALKAGGMTRRLFADLIRNWRGEAVSETLLAKGSLALLLAPFCAGADSVAAALDPAAPRFAEVIRHIEGHLAQPVPVEALAKLAKLETAYFSEQFKKRFGLPPGRYVTRRRLESAARLLLTEDFKLEKIAGRTGFCDAFHLSKSFKKEYGLSPAEFRLRGVLP